MINLLAIFFMVLDHLGLVFFPKFALLRILGRLSFPMFAWGIAKGYRHTKDVKKYAIRLLLLAAIAQWPYFMLFHNGLWNVCFTLLAGLLSIVVIESTWLAIFKAFAIGFFAISAQLLGFDYGAYGVLMIILFHTFWGRDSVVFYQAGLTVLSVLIVHYEPIQLAAIFSPIIILFLQHKDFQINRPFQYSFYPAHMLLFLFLLRIGGVH